MELPKSLATERSLMLKGRPVVLTPRDYAWLKPDECFVVSNVGFEHLEAGNTWRQFSSTAELIRGLRNRSLDFGADERLAIHARVVQPLLDMTLLFLGLPLVLSRSNRNVFLAIGLCLALVVAFMLVVLGCNYLGSSYWFEPATGGLAAADDFRALCRGDVATTLGVTRASKGGQSMSTKTSKRPQVDENATPWVEGLTIPQVLKETARRYGDHDALVFPALDYRLTYRAVRRRGRPRRPRTGGAGHRARRARGDLGHERAASG